MKRLLPLLAFVLLLTACGGKSTSGGVSEGVSGSDTPIGVISSGESTDGAASNEVIEYSEDAIDIKTATESYKADFEACKAAGYPNLSFENTEVFPVAVVESCRKLEDVPFNKQTEELEGQITETEKVEKFKEYCKFFLGDYDEEWGGFDTLDADWDKRKSMEVDGFRYSIFEKLSDHTEEIENEDFHINWMVYVDPYKKNYLWYTPSTLKYPHEFNKGNAAVILKESQNVIISIQTGESAYIPKYIPDEPIARYFNDGTNNDVTYRLADGDCSIGEAIDYFTNEFREALPFDPEDKQPYLVRYIDVFPMTDDTYAYFIRFSPTVGAPIPFERSISMSGSAGSLPDEFSLNCQALMIKKNDIDVANTFAPIYGINETGGEITKMIPLKKAVDIVSERITQAVMFDVIEVDLVYHGKCAPDNDTAAVLSPTWLIRMINPNDALYYVAYIDAVTGNFRIYNYM